MILTIQILCHFERSLLSQVLLINNCLCYQLFDLSDRIHVMLLLRLGLIPSFNQANRLSQTFVSNTSKLFILVQARPNLKLSRIIEPNKLFYELHFR